MSRPVHVLRSFFFFAIVTISTSCASNQHFELIPIGDLETDLSTLVHRFIVIEKVPGMVLLYYSTRTGVIAISDGVSNISTKKPLTPDSKYEIGSTTKTFISVLILDLVEEGLISLEMSIDKWFPDIPNGTRVTIQNLLNQTSGIGDYFYSRKLFDKVFSSEGVSATWHDLVSAGLSNSNNLEAGEWSYSNTNYVLLGRIIEAVTGKTIGTVLKEIIFEPAKMSNTYYMPEEEVKKIDNLAQGYYQNDSMIDDRNYFLYSSAGGIVSTTEDLLKFTLFIASQKDLLKKLTDGCIPCIIENDFQTNYGNGIISTNQYASSELLGHGGTTFGFKSEWWFSASDNSVYIYFTNSKLENRNFHLFREILFEIVEKDQKNLYLKP